MQHLDESSSEKPHAYQSKPLPNSSETVMIPWHGLGVCDPRVITEANEPTSEQTEESTSDSIVPRSVLRPDPLGLDSTQSDSLGPEDFNLAYFGLSPFTPQYSPGPFTPSSSSASSSLQSDVVLDKASTGTRFYPTTQRWSVFSIDSMDQSLSRLIIQCIQMTLINYGEMVHMKLEGLQHRKDKKST